MLKSFNLNEAASSEALRSLAEKHNRVHLKSLFAEDPGRFSKFHLEWEGLLFDYSKNRIDQEVLDSLIALAEEAGLKEAINSMFSGDKINATEDRAVLHTALRSDVPMYVDGQNVLPEVQKVQKAMEAFTNQILSGETKGYTGKQFTDVVNIGIGGSDLGPKMVTEALKKHNVGLKAHFVSNVDGADLEGVLSAIDPDTTLFIVVSKTFTTQETMTNAIAVKDWLLSHFGDASAVKDHFAAVSTNLPAVAEFGIQEERVFGFWDWVGGRYSLWGAVGLSIALSCGWDNFSNLLKGARKADVHFQTTSFKENIPVIMAMIGVWYRNFMDFSSCAVIPYSEQLHRFAAYLQQADMESNGKYIGRDGNKVAHSTGPVVWGEPGTNGQHAFFQLLHQGTDIIPVDFIGFKKPTSSSVDHHQKLMANFLAQQEALMMGKNREQVDNEMESMPADKRALIAPHRVFDGNRPSSAFIFDELNAERLGQLIALYEHKILVQGVLWNVFSFDQWGVELGKQLAKRILPVLVDEITGSFDESTQGQIDFLLGS